MSIDKYLYRSYHPKSYNCAHLVCEVWNDLFGNDLSEMLRAYLCGPNERKSCLSDLRKGRLLDRPQDPCVVLFQAPRSATHVGLFIRKRVLHIIDKRGVQYVPLDVVSFGFTKVRFFTCR